MAEGYQRSKIVEDNITQIKEIVKRAREKFHLQQRYPAHYANTNFIFNNSADRLHDNENGLCTGSLPKTSSTDTAY